jgi:hypothetical protein
MTFYTAGKTVKDIGSTVNERRQKIIELLEKHPEGIVIYCNYPGGQHAIVLTEYDGETFYACDSVNVRDSEEKKNPVKLEDTYLFSKLGSVDAVFENLTDANGVGCVWYVSSAWYVSETTYD